MIPDLLLLINAALAEDIGPGDITSRAMIDANARGRFAFVARQELVLAGGFTIAQVFDELTDDMNIAVKAGEGQKLAAGDVIATIEGSTRHILTGERTALNILQRMCAVATITRSYADAIAGTNATILDTRKTMPGMRAADKYAVRMGGGENHRMGLYDMVLVKDNHLAALAKAESTTIAAALQKRCGNLGVPVVVECDTLEQLADVLEAKPHRIMLDNMPPAMLREAVKLVAGRVKLEATGGITLANIREVAETGVDYISLGAITHSAPNVDIGLDAI